MSKEEIWDSIGEMQTIFIEKEVFTLRYCPETIKHRRSQIQEILYNLKDSLDNHKNPYNMIFKGSRATGKTVTIKYFFSLVEKRYTNVKTVHINCKNRGTQYGIYLKIYEDLFNKKMGVGGLSTLALIDKIVDKLVKKDIILLVALDDMDSVKNDEEINDALYNLLRIHEVDQNAKLAVFSVTKDNTILFLNQDVATVFNAIEVQFPKYTYKEIHNILKQRCDLGLYKGAMSDELLSDIAKFVHDCGDLRKGFDLIYLAGKNAEKEGCHKILRKHLNYSLTKIK